MSKYACGKCGNAGDEDWSRRHGCSVASAKHAPTPEPIESLDRIVKLFEVAFKLRGENQRNYALSEAKQALEAYITERERKSYEYGRLRGIEWVVGQNVLQPKEQQDA